MSTPYIVDTYVVKDDVTQHTREVTGTEMHLYLPRKAAGVVVDPAFDERDGFPTDEDGDTAVGVHDDRIADMGVDPAVLVGADGAAHVGVGVTMDEAARADVAAKGDVGLTTRKPTPGGCGGGDRVGKMAYIVQMPASSLRGFPRVSA